MSKSTAIVAYKSFFSLILVIVWGIAPFSSCVADVLQESLAVELVNDRSLGILFQPTNTVYQGVSDKERHLIEQFAEENQLVAQWIAIDDVRHLIPALINGQGDVIAGHGRSLASSAVAQVTFAYSWGEERQQLVTRADTTRISNKQDFSMRQIALKRSSPSWPILQKSLQQNPSMDLLLIPEPIMQDEIMQRVNAGIYDMTIVDSNDLKTHISKYPNLEVVFDFAATKLQAWAVRSDATILRNNLNSFLERNHLSMTTESSHFEDLPTMRQRKLLRVITYLSPANYFFKNGQMYGFEYAFIKEFAKAEQLDISTVLADSHEDMREILLNGGGDIIAAALPSNSLNDPDITMTVAYDYAMPVVVGRNSEQGMVDVHSLQNRRVVLSSKSPYQPILEDFQHQGIDFDIHVADTAVSTREALGRVSHAIYDLSVLSSQQLTIALSQHGDLKPLFALSQPIGKSWAVRSSSSKLLAALNAYIDKEYRGDIYNTLYNRYLSDPKDIQESINPLLLLSYISPYDELLKEQSRKHNFDWRLIAAQMYQESQFDPDAVSYAGAKGLMQIMPDTAIELGITDLHNPISNIVAGIEYMNVLRAQFEQELLLEEKTWFTLAAYNAGFRRVSDARALAEEMGLDADRWFDNVEKAMLVLAQPYAQQGKAEPVCSCEQTVSYVNGIRSLYHSYVRVTETAEVAKADKILKALDI